LKKDDDFLNKKVPYLFLLTYKFIPDEKKTAGL